MKDAKAKISMIKIRINDKEITVHDGSTVAAAVFAAGPAAFRRSVSGEPRFPLCGIGICFECRVIINGIAGLRSCQTLASEGMKVETDD
jgi:sarcosine oxidase subunit alpha